MRKNLMVRALLCGGVMVLGTSLRAAPMPVSFWINVSDAGGTGNPAIDEKILSSLNDGGYLVATEPITYGGLYNGGAAPGAPSTPAPGVSGVNVQEGVGVLGSVSYHLHYTDPTPLAVGTEYTLNFNIYEEIPGAQLISDTLSITFTGLSIDPTDLSNTSVDFHFLSGSLESTTVPELVPVALPHAISIFTEKVDLSTEITRATGLTAAHVFIDSSVPEPTGMTLVATGLALAGAVRVRRRG